MVDDEEERAFSCLVNGLGNSDCIFGAIKFAKISTAIELKSALGERDDKSVNFR